jgi:hypothetical protein
MKELEDVIRKHIQPSIEAYISNTEKWAKAYYSTQLKKSKFTSSEWAKELGYKDGKLPTNFYNTKEAKRLDKLQTETRRVVNMRLDQFVAKEIQKAKTHCEDATLKLLNRINSKTLNLPELKIENISINQNLDLTISDGVKTFRAYTTFAYGEIQRAHFRYFVK